MSAAVPLQPSSPPGQAPSRAVGMVASTGGPQALVRILAALPGTYPLPVLVIQQRLTRSTQSLAALLATRTALPVGVAEPGAPLCSGVWLPPDGHDLAVSRDGRLLVSRSPDFARSGDRLLSSLADCFGSNACAVVLSGLGDDGALGLARVRDLRGLTVCQDEASAMATSMPRAARPAAQYVAPLEDIARLLVQFARV